MHDDLSPLNIATTARWRRCMDAGGHVPSGREVSREFHGVARQLPVCANCGVPFHRVTPTRWGGYTAPKKRQRKRKG